MTAIEDARAVVRELRDAQGDGTDWTEDLFKRAADMIEILTTDIEAVRRVVGAVINDGKYGGDIEWVRLNLRPVAKGTYPRSTAAVERLTTPPTDDDLADDFTVLVEAILSARWANGEPLSGVTTRTAQMIAAPILAAGFRRQGPITDEWEYEHLTRYSGEYVSTWRPCGPNAHGTKRRRKVGPWESVEAARDV